MVDTKDTLNVRPTSTIPAISGMSDVAVTPTVERVPAWARYGQAFNVTGLKPLQVRTDADGNVWREHGTPGGEAHCEAGSCRVRPATFWACDTLGMVVLTTTNAGALVGMGGRQFQGKDRLTADIDPAPVKIPGERGNLWDVGDVLSAWLQAPKGNRSPRAARNLPGPEALTLWEDGDLAA